MHTPDASGHNNTYNIERVFETLWSYGGAVVAQLPPSAVPQESCLFACLLSCCGLHTQGLVHSLQCTSDSQLYLATVL